MNKPIRDQRRLLALCSVDCLDTMVSFRHRAPGINGHSPLPSSATSHMATAFTILCIHQSIRLLAHCRLLCYWRVYQATHEPPAISTHSRRTNPFSISQTKTIIRKKICCQEYAIMFCIKTNTYWIIQ